MPCLLIMITISTLFLGFKTPIQLRDVLNTSQKVEECSEAKAHSLTITTSSAVPSFLTLKWELTFVSHPEPPGIAVSCIFPACCWVSFRNRGVWLFVNTLFTDTINVPGWKQQGHFASSFLPIFVFTDDIFPFLFVFFSPMPFSPQH